MICDAHFGHGIRSCGRRCGGGACAIRPPGSERGMCAEMCQFGRRNPPAGTAVDKKNSRSGSKSMNLSRFGRNFFEFFLRSRKKESDTLDRKQDYPALSKIKPAESAGLMHQSLQRTFSIFWERDPFMRIAAPCGGFLPSSAARSSEVGYQLIQDGTSPTFSKAFLNSSPTKKAP